jgi:hypothetical protein
MAAFFSKRAKTHGVFFQKGENPVLYIDRDMLHLYIQLLRSIFCLPQVHNCYMGTVVCGTHLYQRKKLKELLFFYLIISKG